MEQYLFNLKQQLHQKENANAAIVEQIIRETLAAIVGQDEQVSNSVEDSNELNESESLENNSYEDDSYQTFKSFF